jgi:hypothetical protein
MREVGSGSISIKAADIGESVSRSWNQRFGERLSNREPDPSLPQEVSQSAKRAVVLHVSLRSVARERNQQVDSSSVYLRKSGVIEHYSGTQRETRGGPSIITFSVVSSQE